MDITTYKPNNYTTNIMLGNIVRYIGKHQGTIRRIGKYAGPIQQIGKAALEIKNI